MMIFINYLMTIVGIGFCFYVMMSKRIDTSRPTCAAKINLWMALWICLLLAVGFLPTVMTTLARALALILNVLHFKNRLRFRSKKQE